MTCKEGKVSCHTSDLTPERGEPCFAARCPLPAARCPLPALPESPAQRVTESPSGRFPCLPRLRLELRDPVGISGGEVEGDKTLGGGLAGQGACLTGGQVLLLGGQLGILFQEGGFDEQEIGTAGEVDDAPGVLLVKDHINHIGNLLPVHQPQ